MNKKDFYFLSGIIIFSLILTGYYISFNMKLGIYCSDVYIYLLNALYFAGTNINSDSTIYLSPVICYLTSILFKLGITDRLAILIVTGLFAIIGNIGLYILLRIRFDETLSLAGAILFSTFAINLTWLANGSIDLPAVSITIWIVLLTIISVKNNPKYYIPLIPIIIIGFFTRYTVILILPVLLLYYLYNNGFRLEKNTLKFLIIGAIFGIITAAAILIPVISLSNGYFGVVEQISGGISGSKGSVTDLAYNTDVTYYLANFINFISASKVTFANRTPVLESPTLNSIVVLAILAIGSVLFIVNNKTGLKKINKLAIIILAASAVSFNHISAFITLILIFIGLYLLGKDSEYKTGLTMVSWILAYLIFFSYLNIKVNRYIMPAIPPLIYLIVYSIELIQSKIRINKNILPIILIVLFLMQGFTFCLAFEETDEFIAPDEMSEFIINDIPDYENQTIGVYNKRPYNWYLGENITGIERNDASAIDGADISYYISDIPQNNLKNFQLVKTIDGLYLYEKKSN